MEQGEYFTTPARSCSPVPIKLQIILCSTVYTVLLVLPSIQRTWNKMHAPALSIETIDLPEKIQQ
jgi:hypothetical protein